MRDEVRRLLRAEGIGYTGLSGRDQTVTVRIRDEADIAKAKEALAPLTQAESGGLLSGGLLQEITLDEPEPGLFRLNITDEGLDFRMTQAVSQTVEVLRGRIDELGTTEPVIQRQAQTALSCRFPGSTIRSG